MQRAGWENDAEGRVGERQIDRKGKGNDGEGWVEERR